MPLCKPTLIHSFSHSAHMKWTKVSVHILGVVLGQVCLVNYLVSH